MGGERERERISVQPSENIRNSCPLGLGNDTAGNTKGPRGEGKAAEVGSRARAAQVLPIRIVLTASRSQSTSHTWDGHAVSRGLSAGPLSAGSCCGWQL